MATLFVRSLRVLFIALVLALVAPSVSADVLVPGRDTGGPGGGGGIGTIDETERASNLSALSGGGFATIDESERAANLTALSGGAVAHTPMTANQRSIQLIESTFAPGGMLAGGTAPSARIPWEDSEHAVAENRNVAVAEAPNSPHVSDY